MKSFLFILSLPSETVAQIETMSPAAQEAKVRRMIAHDGAAILRMLAATVLDQIRDPREIASIQQGPGGESARVVTRLKKSASELPETDEVERG